MIRKTRIDYDPEGDVLYISFGGKPQPADDSDVTEEGVIVRLKEGKIVGLTIPTLRREFLSPFRKTFKTET